MNNDDENSKKVVLDIPGVIIPPQTTEDGDIIVNAIDDSKEVVASSNVAQVSTSNTENKVVEEVKKEDVNVNNNLQDNVQAVDVNVAPIKEEIKTVAPSQTPPEVVNTPANVFATPTNNENNLPKESKPKKKNSSILYILIIVILLMGLGYFIYNDYIVPKEELDPAVEWQRKRTVDKNSLVVQELYSYVNLDGCGDQLNFFYKDLNDVKLTDLSDIDRNYLAYRQLKHREISTRNCSNYSVSLRKNDKVGLWSCGENDKEDITTVINEEDLKRQVNKMFGEGIYKSTTFSTSSSGRYLYDSKTASYIYQTFSGENNCTGFSNKLDSSYQEGDNITIVVKTTSNESKKIYMFYYTFTESIDGNYYFSYLKKKAV